MSYVPCLAVFVCLVANGCTQWAGLEGAIRAKWLRVVSDTLNVTQSAYIWNADSGISFSSRSRELVGTGIARSRTYTDYSSAKVAAKLQRDVGRTCFLLDVVPALIGTFSATSTALQALTLLNTTVEKSYHTAGSVMNATSQSAFNLKHPFIQKKCSDRRNNYVATTEMAAGAPPPAASDKFTFFTSWGTVHLYILRSTGLVTTTTATPP
ncbi:uncharacterized protein 6-like [Haliotis rufescens]|uniref:uncharacterized protein 6-like n=1 Tax=Haliotis rufescens TaxID=6454 RepID=UPI00201F4025|nr:uncharacterized protein 6-like [Haliotis rufescens]